MFVRTPINYLRFYFVNRNYGIYFYFRCLGASGDLYVRPVVNFHREHQNKIGKINYKAKIKNSGSAIFILKFARGRASRIGLIFKFAAEKSTEMGV